jgi:hypothetical protein
MGEGLFLLLLSSYLLAPPPFGIFAALFLGAFGPGCSTLPVFDPISGFLGVFGPGLQFLRLDYVLHQFVPRV